MIVYPNGSFATKSGQMNVNFADGEWKDKVLVIDDKSELGQQILNGDIFNAILDNGKVVDIEILEKPSEIEGKIIQLFKNEQGQWKYIYVDTSKTQEEIQQEKINQLESALLEMSTISAIQQAQNEQAIMELTMMLGGM